MAMNPKDLLLANGARQPKRHSDKRGADWIEPRRTFRHERLHQALAAMSCLPKEPKS